MPGTMKDNAYTEHGLQSLRLAFHLEDLPWLDWPPRLPYPIVPFGSLWLLKRKSFQTQNRSNSQQKMKNGWLQPMKMKPYEADHMTSRAFSPAWPLTHAWRSFIDGINWAGAGWQRLANSLLPAKARWFSQENTRSPDLLLLRIAEEQAGCCLRFKPRHAFSPERSGIEAEVERDTRPAMFRKRREVVRLSIDGKTRSGALKNLLVH